MKNDPRPTLDELNQILATQPELQSSFPVASTITMLVLVVILCWAGYQLFQKLAKEEKSNKN